VGLSGYSLYEKLFLSPVWDGEVFYKEYALNNGRINTKNQRGVPNYLTNIYREEVISGENDLCTRLINQNERQKQQNCANPMLSEGLHLLELTFELHKHCLNIVKESDWDTLNGNPQRECSEDERRRKIAHIEVMFQRLSDSLISTAKEIDKRIDKICSTARNQKSI